MPSCLDNKTLESHILLDGLGIFLREIFLLGYSCSLICIFLSCRRVRLLNICFKLTKNKLDSN